jgi:glycolate dehydrogenase iron-sulfur subunit
MDAARALQDAGSDSPALADLDVCTRCGMCEQACPTYRLLGVEADSPRGRIFMMKDVAEGRATVDEFLAEHLYACLGCRACETACPSGVRFGHLLELGRAQVEANAPPVPGRAGWRFFRDFLTRRLLPNRVLTAAFLAPARFISRHRSVRNFLLALPLPARVRTMIAMLPDAPHPGGHLPAVIPAAGERRARVGLFLGCVMNELYPHVHAATVRVLRRQGFEIAVPPKQWCCGALNVHAGERAAAKAMARSAIDAFESAAVEMVVTNSAGCGAMLKAYGELLNDDPKYAERARRFSTSVRDATEVLRPLSAGDGLLSGRSRVTYQDACHLAHAQKIREQPRALLRSIGGVELTEMADSDRCCGAAGLHALTHPEIAAKLADEKIDNAVATHADTIVVCNPGCDMHLRAAIQRRGLNLTVRHLLELVDEAYAGAAGTPITR